MPPGRLAVELCLSDWGKDESPDKGLIPTSTVLNLSMEVFCCDGAVGLSWLPLVAMVLEDLTRPLGAKRGFDVGVASSNNSR